ncbi:MAG TPA: glycosyltransferase 87 family protein, partial [Solirubrobacteraceae bacterium]
LSRATALGLCAAGPIAERALEIGHPEEILGGTLCVAAVLAAGSRRTVWAGVLLGLAVATKAWALLAVGPVLLALPARHWRALLIAGLVVAAILAPLAVAHPRAFAAKTGSMATTGAIFQPWQAWWFLGEHAGVVRGTSGQAKPGYRTAPPWIARVTHPLIIVLGAVLTALLWLVRGRRGATALDALLLLALLLHLRCVLDTWNFAYYAVPFLLALVTWEGLARRRPPVLSLLASVAIWIFWQELPIRGVAPDTQAAAYLLWALPVAAGLGLRLYAPGAWSRVIGLAANVGPAPAPKPA